MVNSISIDVKHFVISNNYQEMIGFRILRKISIDSIT